MKQERTSHRLGTAGLIAGAAFWMLAGVLTGCGGGTGEEGNQMQAGNQESRMDQEGAAGEESQMGQESGSVEKAVAELSPTEGNDVHGTVTFEAVAGGVKITASLEGLSAGDHGFHIHETGDCSAADATSAGGHFNPDNSPHGAPDDPRTERHAGDLGNIQAGVNGTATYERTDPIIKLDGENSILGRAVIVHAGADDLESQPTGDAGGRLACGVIEAEKHESSPAEGY